MAAKIHPRLVCSMFSIPHSGAISVPGQIRPLQPENRAEEPAARFQNCRWDFNVAQIFAVNTRSIRADRVRAPRGGSRRARRSKGGFAGVLLLRFYVLIWR